MSDPTIDKWTELNEKLEQEIEVTEAILESQRSIARNLFIVGALLAALTIVFVFVFAGNAFIELIVLAPGLLTAIAVFFGLRYQNMAGHSRDEIDRIRRDIRKWKKQKPA